MKLFVVKLGSKVTPSSPRSPAGSTLSVMNGAGNRTPFLITRSDPFCSQTNTRPSGAMSIAVGFKIPATLVSVKPAGNVAAFVEKNARSRKHNRLVNRTKHPLTTENSNHRLHTLLGRP